MMRMRKEVLALTAAAGMSVFPLHARAGDVAFAPPVLIEHGLSIWDFDFADIDNDGDMDIILNQGLPPGPGQPSVIGILKNRGDATFDPIVTYPIGPSLSLPMAIADVDNDGDLDIVTTEVLSFSVSKVVVLYNDGNGAFPERREFPGGAQPQQAAAGDITGDGWPDIVITMSSENAVWLYENDGAGGFLEPIAFVTGAGPSPLRLADFDGDGDLDVCVDHVFQSNSVVFIENVNGVLGPLHHLTASISGRKIPIGDFNGDGLPDIVTSNHGFQILLNLGGFRFHYSNPIAPGDGTTSAPGDVDLNGAIGLTAIAAGDPVNGQFGDVDLDGVIDIVALRCQTSGPQALVVVTDLEGPPYGLYPDLAPVGTSEGVIDGTDLVQLLNEWGPGPVGGSAIDLNHDLAADGWDLARLLANWGPLPETPPWQTHETVFDAELCVSLPRLVDLDGDGDLDAVSAGNGVDFAIGTFLFFENQLISPPASAER